MSDTYEAFLRAKRIHATPQGFDPTEPNPNLFPFQRDIVTWACRKGRAAIWLDCGMGKTACQLEWARQVHDHTGRDILVLAPLAVARQTAREADKFAIAAPVTVCRTLFDAFADDNLAEAML